MWNSNEPDRTKHATNVRAATVRLRTKLVPELAGAIKDEEDVNIGDIISRMHSLGINVRHLGLVRAALGSSDCLASRVILREMVRFLLVSRRHHPDRSPGASSRSFKNAGVRPCMLANTPTWVRPSLPHFPSLFLAPDPRTFTF